MTTPLYPSPEYATTGAAWLKRLQWALGLLVLGAVLGVLLPRQLALEKAAERLALQHAERGLRDAVWLQSQRRLAVGGVDALVAMANQDPRQWRDAAGGALDGRFRFVEASGELVFTPRWLEGGERRWQVQVIRVAVDGGATQSRGAQLVFLGPAY